MWFYVSSDRSGAVWLGVTVAEGVGNGFSTQEKRLCVASPRKLFIMEALQVAS